MRRIFRREAYLKKIRPFYQSDLIKVITGIRRCGKSCLLESIMQELREAGIPDKDIIYLNLDRKNYISIKRPEQLQTVIDSLDIDSDKKYLFIDEIQNVKGFESLINAYKEEGRFSIFITESNSYLLSGELVTKLTGRYVEIPLFPLSFHEYLEMKRFLGKTVGALPTEFTLYLRAGGFPQALEFDDLSAKYTYLTNIMEQILKKDMTPKNKIRNHLAFEKVRTYLINNFGCTTNLNALVEYMKNTNQAILKKETLKRYLDILENAKILSKCSRFDLKSKKSLQRDEKYYLADTGLYFAVNTDERINYGPVLENVVYIYLLSKGYKVSVGRIGKLECDFIARRDDDYFYIQVALSIMDPKTEDREYAPLEAIRDNYPKYVFTLDTLLQRRKGIHHLNLIDFIANDSDLGRVSD
ncbi:MAG: ATP-binding protein [Victivallales bacterium]|nr:ATP-binding protein [Victivallales bacterium]